MKHRLQLISILMIISGIFFIIPTSLAQADTATESNTALDRFQRTGTALGYEENAQPKLTNQIGTVIGYFISALGILFLIQALWAGYTWMTAHGNEEKLTSAKKALQSSIIGFIITMSAYAISITVVSRIANIASASQQGDSEETTVPHDAEERGI